MRLILFFLIGSLQLEIRIFLVSYSNLDGVLILSAMKNIERRKERMIETIENLKKRYRDFIDLTPFEEMGFFLELKGSLVTDWDNGKIYCSLS